MTQTALRSADEHQRTLATSHRKPCPNPLVLVRRRAGRRESATAQASIDELIWQAIADQPLQLYRGGA